MTRNEAKALQAKHNMEILRDPITSEARALYLEAEQPISELDDLADISRRSNGCAPCCMEANYEVYNATGSGVTYKLSCPTTWFDLWGWVDEQSCADHISLPASPGGTRMKGAFCHD